MSTTKDSLTDETLLPSPAGAGSGAGQPAIASWLERDGQRIISQLTHQQRAWVLEVCEAARARGVSLTPTSVVRAGIERLMGEHTDPTAASELISG